MKCKKCGANLEIDTAFCPYCGVANPVAKKHREDMRKFEKDYADTKKEVIDNTKKFNRKTFLVTVIAVTFVLLAILVLMTVFGDKVKYNMKRAERERNSGRYVGTVEQLIKDKDYLKLAEVKSRYSLRTYNTPLERYESVLRAAEYYSNVHRYVLSYLYKKNVSSYTFLSSVSDYTDMVYKSTENEKDEEMLKEIENIISDMELFFKTYLKLTDDEIASLKGLTDAQRSVLIEEALNNAREE